MVCNTKYRNCTFAAQLGIWDTLRATSFVWTLVRRPSLNSNCTSGKSLNGRSALFKIGRLEKYIRLVYHSETSLFLFLVFPVNLGSQTYAVFMCVALRVESKLWHSAGHVNFDQRPCTAGIAMLLWKDWHFQIRLQYMSFLAFLFWGVIKSIYSCYRQV